VTARPAPLRRVIVALNAARRSHAVLEPATRLAGRLGADLVALFVEDEDLLRLASLPFAQLVGPTAKPLSVDRPAMERALRQAQAEARGALETAARRHGVKQVFHVARSPIHEALAAVAGTGDLVVLERGELGRAIAAAVACAETSVLCWSATARAAAPVAIVFEAGEAGAARLEIAAHVAAVAGRELIVISAEPGAADVEREVADVAARAGIRVRLEFVVGRASFPPSSAATAGAVIAVSRAALGNAAAEGAKMFEGRQSVLVLC
jgi:hypothetical protein